MKCEDCQYEDTEKCDTCQEPDRDSLKIKLAGILKSECEKIGGGPADQGRAKTDINQ